MENKEHLSRRGAFLAGLVWASAGVAAGVDVYLHRSSLAGSLRGFLEHSPQLTENSLAELENYIEVSTEGQWGRATRVNKSAFATALAMVAIKMDPERGFSRLTNHLSKHPFKIAFADEGDVSMTRTGYQPVGANFFYWGRDDGKLLFRPGFMRQYKTAILENNAGRLKECHELFFHEFGHLWQRVVCPERLLLNDGVTFTIEAIRTLPEELQNLPQYDHNSNPLEVEAEAIMQAVIGSQLDGIDRIEDFPWPFGRFFSFRN